MLARVITTGSFVVFFTEIYFRVSVPKIVLCECHIVIISVLIALVPDDISNFH